MGCAVIFRFSAKPDRAKNCRGGCNAINSGHGFYLNMIALDLAAQQQFLNDFCKEVLPCLNFQNNLQTRSLSSNLHHHLAFGAPGFDIIQRFLGRLERKHPIHHRTYRTGINERSDLVQLPPVCFHKEK